MKNVYFLSDAHLGSLAIPLARMQECRVVRFLDSIKTKAAAVYLLGDMFDFCDGFAGELGHVIMVPGEEGRPCGCGRKGCLEAYCSFCIQLWR